MEPEKTKGILFLVFIFGVLFQLLGCALWHNWWPMLTAFMYVLVPMPNLFFGGFEGDYGGVWVDAGKFLTGFSAIGTIAVPTILFHAGKIVLGALWMQYLAVACMAVSVVGYDVVNRDPGGGFYSY